MAFRSFNALNRHRRSPVRKRFWAEAVLGGLSALLLLVTLVWRDWIEIVFGFEPDAGSGAVEWLIVAVTALVTVLCALGARTEWRRTHPAAAPAAR
ncbi:ABC transporter permease [Streptomyces sp. WI04-05B]|uniref:ABC transporter permease n=1 Tax=Streptomyces TaxID=1883 RepID=UPI0029BF65A4|nr:MULTISPECIES: ABC transporter permease [unclassified Streptomyces]MDX2540577.1 ABC transporter permease [Streptomyces sp. WI04-05B]MDX2584991.1 ABC transporter permease [Streptomyces sp. WI04-05A]MDX3749259.1 ABC transporter permease [Streptomyces sp. AK08-02]